jgi:hypothetical protein
MSETGSTAIEPYPHAVKAKHTDNGIVKFPVNVHGIYIEKSALSGQQIDKGLRHSSHSPCRQAKLHEGDSMSRTKVSVVGQLEFSEEQGRLMCSVQVGKSPQLKTAWIDVPLPNAERDLPGLGPAPKQPKTASKLAEDKFYFAREGYDRALREHPNYKDAVSKFIELQDREPASPNRRHVDVSEQAVPNRISRGTGQRKGCLTGKASRASPAAPLRKSTARSGSARKHGKAGGVSRDRAVPHRWNPKRSHPAAAFRDVHPSQWARFITTLSE